MASQSEYPDEVLCSRHSSSKCTETDSGQGNANSLVFFGDHDGFSAIRQANAALIPATLERVFGVEPTGAL